MLSKIKIGQVISLNQAERKLAHFIAKNRNGSNRSFNVTNLKISSDDAATVDLEGIAGEIAFCKLFKREEPRLSDFQEAPAEFGRCLGCFVLASLLLSP